MLHILAVAGYAKICCFGENTVMLVSNTNAIQSECVGGSLPRRAAEVECAALI